MFGECCCQGNKNIRHQRYYQLYQNSGSKIEFHGSEISVDKISAPPHEDERKHSFLVRSSSVEKRLSLVPNI